MENQESKKEPMYVAFSTQKGGAGKTTLPFWLQVTCIYDQRLYGSRARLRYPQHSIAEMRERDFKTCENDEYYKGMLYEQFLRLEEKKAYPVIESDTKEALNEAEDLIKEGDYDFIFFDLPGTLNNEGLVRTIASMDYIVAPISADRLVLESTLDYLISVRDNIVNTGKSNIKGIYLLWNLVDGREKSELYEVYESVIKELDLPLLKTFIPDSKRFRREQSASHKSLFRSTLFPADKSLVKGSNLDVLADELLGLFK